MADESGTPKAGGIIGGIFDGVIALGQFLAALPEQDRQKVIADLKGQAAALSADTQALQEELSALREEHAALKAQLDAQPKP